MNHFKVIIFLKLCLLDIHVPVLRYNGVLSQPNGSLTPRSTNRISENDLYVRPPVCIIQALD